MGLASLLLSTRNAGIMATDYHPEAGKFLLENARLNQSTNIPFLRASWDNKDDGLGKLDLLIGADLLYERDHIEQVSKFIERHANAKCEILLADLW